MNNELVTDDTAAKASIHGTPGDYARMRGLFLAFIPLFFIAGIAGMCLGWLLHAWIHSPFWIVACAGFLAVTAAVYLHQMPVLTRAYLKGARGEEAIAAELNRLPGEWHVFHGFMLAKRCEADHIAVGPQGVFLIETKFWTGRIALEQGTIQVNDREAIRSPILQIRNLVQALQRRFSPEEGNVPSVTPVICFVGQNFEQGLAFSDEVTVCNQYRLLQVLTEGPPRLSEEEINRLVMDLS